MAIAIALLLPLGSFSQTNTFKISSSKRTLGKKLYEQNDHVGSVRAVVSDAREVQRSGTDLLAFAPRVDSWTETYAYGSNAPARNASSTYRYGFNGMEQDDELHGDGNAYTTDYRLYDTRVGRWMSTDPVRHDNWSPYNAFDDNPIALSDPSGADADGGWDVAYTETVTNTDAGPVTELTVISATWNPNTNYNRFVLAECPKPGDTRVAEINGEEYKVTFAPPPLALYMELMPDKDARDDQYSTDINGWVDYAEEPLSDVNWDNRLYYADDHDPDMEGFYEVVGAMAVFATKVNLKGVPSPGKGVPKRPTKVNTGKKSQSGNKKSPTKTQALQQGVKNLPNMNRAQIKSMIDNKFPSLTYKGGSPDGRFMQWKDKSGTPRVRIDPADKVTKYDHIHLYNKKGQPLDINLQVKPATSVDVHIPIKPG